VAKILIVDNEPAILEMVTCGLEPSGFDLDTAPGGLPAIEKMQQRDYDVVITDIRMDDADGFQVLEAARARPSPPEVIIITGFGSIHSAVDAMKLGAADYIAKPLDIARLAETVGTILERRKGQSTGPADRVDPADGDFAGMVGRSEPMQQLYRLIQQVAPTSSTVMIAGESGAGKELVARAIHANSPRRDGPFVAIECGSVPESLLESELFGHVRGAFTGAVDDKTGLFEAANGGTVLLDEISEMKRGLQQKLLRSIQEKAVRPIGSTTVRKVDVRILSATNRDLGALVAQKTFREDLYYRLNVVPIPVPSLAERREDIPLLAQHFARKYARRFRRRAPAISDTVLAVLSKANWPGSVRQLENVIECAVTFTDGDEVRPEHLPPDFIDSFALAGNVAAGNKAARKRLKPADITPLGAAIRYLERQMLSKALDASNGNKEQAAQMLGIDRATLYRKLKAYKLAEGRQRSSPN